jgi:hypothetical protein
MLKVKEKREAAGTVSSDFAAAATEVSKTGTPCRHKSAPTVDVSEAFFAFTWELAFPLIRR